MLPARLDANAFFRTVTDRPGDGAQLGAFHAHVHGHHARLVALRGLDFAGFDAGAGDQPCRGYRAAQVELEAALVDIARFETGDTLEMAA